MPKTILAYIWGAPYHVEFHNFEFAYYQAQFEAERMGYAFSKYWVW